MDKMDKQQNTTHKQTAKPTQPMNTQTGKPGSGQPSQGGQQHTQPGNPKR